MLAGTRNRGALVTWSVATAVLASGAGVEGGGGGGVPQLVLVCVGSLGAVGRSDGDLLAVEGNPLCQPVEPLLVVQVRGGRG